MVSLREIPIKEFKITTRASNLFNLREFTRKESLHEIIIMIALQRYNVLSDFLRNNTEYATTDMEIDKPDTIENVLVFESSIAKGKHLLNGIDYTLVADRPFKYFLPDLGFNLENRKLIYLTEDDNILGFHNWVKEEGSEKFNIFALQFIKEEYRGQGFAVRSINQYLDEFEIENFIAKFPNEAATNLLRNHFDGRYTIDNTRTIFDPFEDFFNAEASKKNIQKREQ